MAIWLLALVTQRLWKLLVDALFFHLTNSLNHLINLEEANLVKTFATIEDQVPSLDDEV